MAMDIAQDSSEEEGDGEDGTAAASSAAGKRTKHSVVETTALGKEARRRLLHAAGGQPEAAPPPPTPRRSLPPLDLSLPAFTELAVRGGPSEAAAVHAEAEAVGSAAERGEAAELDLVDRVRACGRDDLFGVLGLARGAHTDEVRPAYLAVSKAVHPDKNPDRLEDATEAMQIVTDAHKVLGDARRRRAYMLARSWQQYADEIQRAEKAEQQDQSDEVHARRARREEKRQREGWGGRSDDGRVQRQDRSHRHRAETRAQDRRYPNPYAQKRARAQDRT